MLPPEYISFINPTVEFPYYIINSFASNSYETGINLVSQVIEVAKNVSIFIGFSKNDIIIPSLYQVCIDLGFQGDYHRLIWSPTPIGNVNPFDNPFDNFNDEIYPKDEKINPLKGEDPFNPCC